MSRFLLQSLCLDPFLGVTRLHSEGIASTQWQNPMHRQLKTQQLHKMHHRQSDRKLQRAAAVAKAAATAAAAVAKAKAKAAAATATIRGEWTKRNHTNLTRIRGVRTNRRRIRMAAGSSVTA